MIAVGGMTANEQGFVSVPEFEKQVLKIYSKLKLKYKCHKQLLKQA